MLIFTLHSDFANFNINTDARLAFPFLILLIGSLTMSFSYKQSIRLTLFASDKLFLFHLNSAFKSFLLYLSKLFFYLPHILETHHHPSLCKGHQEHFVSFECPLCSLKHISDRLSSYHL